MAYLSDSDDEVIQKVITKVMTCLGDSDDAVSCLARNVLDKFEQGKNYPDIQCACSAVRIFSLQGFTAVDKF